MSEKPEFNVTRITKLLNDASGPVKLLSLSNGVIDNANVKSTKEHRDRLDAFMELNAEVAGFERVGKRGWTLKGKAQPKQAEFDAPGMERETNEACEEIAQELATALIARDKAQAEVSEKSADLKEAMKGEGLAKYVSYSEEDGGKRTWRITKSERLTLTKPKDDSDE